jgi:hypothetical protein
MPPAQKKYELRFHGTAGKETSQDIMSEGLHSLGKVLIIFGALAIGIGGILLLSGKLPWFGKLPGDILIQKKNFTFYFPIATSILISIILTLLLWVFGRK